MLQHFLALCQLGLAVAVLAVMGSDLWLFDGWASTRVCLMGGSVNLCSYTSFVCFLSIVLSLFLSLSRCGAGGGSARSAGGRAAAALFGLAWWIATATVDTVYSIRADSSADPVLAGAAGSRTAVWGMAWALLALYALSAAAAVHEFVAARRAEQEQQLLSIYPQGACTVYPGAPQQQSLYATALPRGLSYAAGRPSYLPPSPYQSAKQFTAWGVPAGQQAEQPSTEFTSIKLV